MQLECWNIQGSSFHFGQHGLGQEQTMVTMPSDRLFAAMIAALAQTQGAQSVVEFCQPFMDGRPPFVFSSTFPYAGNVRFFPVPMLSRRVEEQDVDSKDLKRVGYISEGVFRDLLAGVSLAKLYDPKYLIQGKTILLNADDFKQLPRDLKSAQSRVWNIEQRPRVTLDRSSSTSNLFYIGQVNFAKKCGLWFVVHWLDASPAMKTTFTNLLNELGAAGFGAERSVGLGIATVSMTGSLILPDVTGAWVTLSRYLPKEDETAGFSHHNSAYSIKAVGGWVESPTNKGQRRIPLNLIEAGSVFGSKPVRSVPGQIVDVRPRYHENNDPLGHAVYRCGFALAVGLEGGTA